MLLALALDATGRSQPACLAADRGAKDSSTSPCPSLQRRGEAVCRCDLGRLRGRELWAARSWGYPHSFRKDLMIVSPAFISTPVSCQACVLETEKAAAAWGKAINVAKTKYPLRAINVVLRTI